MYYVVVGDAKTQFKDLEKVGLGNRYLLKIENLLYICKVVSKEVH